MKRGLALPKPDRYAKRERVDYTKAAIPKDIAQPDAIFRARVRAMGCQVRRINPTMHPVCSPMRGSDYSAQRAVIDFCHTPAPGKKGMSRKASDVGNGIGMCHDLHMEQESIGWKTFQSKYQFDAVAIARELGEAYEAKRLPKGDRK